MNTSVISSPKSAKNPPDPGAGDYRVDNSKFGNPSAPPLEPPRAAPRCPPPATAPEPVATPRQRPAPPTTERSATLTIDTETGEIFTKTYPEHDFNKSRYKAPTQVEQLDLNKSVETDNFFKYFPIVIYDGAILSGMSRAIAAEKSGTVLLNGVDIIEFDGTREEAERFPDAANFAHRELGPDQKRVLRARWYNLLAKASKSSKAKAAISLKLKGVKPQGQNDPGVEHNDQVADTLAAKEGVSASTIKRDAAFADQHPDKAQAVMEGKIGWKGAQAQARAESKQQDNRKRWNIDGRYKPHRNLSTDEHFNEAMDEIKKSIDKIANKAGLEGILTEKTDDATTNQRVDRVFATMRYLTKVAFGLRVVQFGGGEIGNAKAYAERAVKNLNGLEKILVPGFPGNSREITADIHKIVTGIMRGIEEGHI
jgi:hypothetical protein